MGRSALWKVIENILKIPVRCPSIPVRIRQIPVRFPSHSYPISMESLLDCCICFGVLLKFLQLPSAPIEFNLQMSSKLWSLRLVPFAFFCYSTVQKMWQLRSPATLDTKSLRIHSHIFKSVDDLSWCIKMPKSFPKQCLH